MFKSAALLAVLAMTSGCSIILHPVGSAIGVSSSEIAALPPGTQVGIICRPTEDSMQNITGTVLQSGPEGLVLMNCSRLTQCVKSTPVVGELPYFNRLFKNTGVAKEKIPVLWVPTSDVESTHVMTPASPDSLPPTVDIDLSHGFVEERIGVDYDFSIDDVRPSLSKSEHDRTEE